MSEEAKRRPRYRWVRKEGSDYVSTATTPGKIAWEGPFPNMGLALAWIDEQERRDKAESERHLVVAREFAERLTRLNASDDEMVRQTSGPGVISGKEAKRAE